MRALRLILFLGLALFLLYKGYTETPPVQHAESQSHWDQPDETSAASTENGVPQKALKVLAVIRKTGSPPEGYVGGRVFQNREHRLPADGDYREFDVDPHRGGRNAERIVMEWNSKKAWYTDDHYQTFTPLP